MKKEHVITYASLNIFDKIKKRANHFGDGINVVYGIKKDTIQVQSLHFDATMYLFHDVLTLLKGGLKELGKPMFVQEYARNNPASHVFKTLKHMYKDELKSIKKYNAFISDLKKDPVYHKYAFIIRNIITDEENHIKSIRAMFKGV